MKRYSDNLLIAYDGDRAGIAAAGRAAALALAAGMDVKVAKLPPGMDPADLIKENPQAFKDAIKGALHIVDFYLAHIADAKYDARTYRLEVSRTVLPYVAMIRNGIDQAHFVKRVAGAIGVPEDAVFTEVKKLGRGVPAAPGGAVGIPAAEPFLSRGDTIERLLSGLLSLFREQHDAEEVARIEVALTKAGTVMKTDADDRAALFEADFFLERNTDTAGRRTALDELYADFARESAHERYRETLSALRAAETSTDPSKAEELMRELARLAPEL